jgi:hypothetical protein
MVHKGDNPGKTSILFFPMIDLEPVDTCMSCIYTTLMFTTGEAAKLQRMTNHCTGNMLSKHKFMCCGTLYYTSVGSICR